MATNGRPAVIDADGHVFEREADIKKYLEPPYDRRNTSLTPGDQPWDTHLYETFEDAISWMGISPAEQVERWHNLMDREGIETAMCFPTISGGVSKLQETNFQIAAARACNNYFANEFNARSDRMQCVGVLPLRSPEAAAEELRRAVTELGIRGFEFVTTGPPLALGDPFYDPVYKAAQELGAAICVHGTRSQSRDLGASGLSTFAEVHAYAFPAGLLLQFTSMICQGITVRFPNLRIAFLEIGATWLPYYLDRLNEHWEMRGEYEMPLLKKSPSETVKDANIWVSLEAGETMLGPTVDYIGAEHLLYASDVPHWDSEFPESLENLWERTDVSTEDKEKILYHNAKKLFAL